MGLIDLTVSGNFDNLEKFLRKNQLAEFRSILEAEGRAGVAALSSATPVDSGATAAAWDYEVSLDGKGGSITWTNSNVHNGVPIAIILQYGHGTGTGGYVQGRDYINPAIRPVMDEISQKVGEALRK